MPQKKRTETLLGVLAVVLAVISVLCFFAAYQLRAQAKQNMDTLPSRMLVGQFSKDFDQNEVSAPQPACLNQPQEKSGAFSACQFLTVL